MEPFQPFETALLPLPRVDVDTDQITPARFLKTSLGPGGYGEILFHDWRYDESGAPRPEFVMNRPERQGATLLVAGDNFGCGSSRETAVWALVEAGLRGVVSTSFGDIFRNNALKNGLLPLQVSETELQHLLRVAEDPEARVRVDLESRTLAVLDEEGEARETITFPIDGFYRHCLLRGLDTMGYLLAEEQAIAAHEAAHPLPSLVQI